MNRTPENESSSADYPAPAGDSPSPSAEAPPYSPVIDRPRVGLATLIVALAAGSVVYRVLVRHHLEQTAALFIGLPTLLALILTFAPRARSAIGIAVRGTTLALLMSGILLGEGFVCIIMAAPLFYGIAILTAVAIQALKKKTANSYPPALYSLVVLPLLPFAPRGSRRATLLLSGGSG